MGLYVLLFYVQIPLLIEDQILFILNLLKIFDLDCHHIAFTFYI